MIQLWAACKVDSTGTILESEKIVSVTRSSAGVYRAQLENPLGQYEFSGAAVPWYIENAIPVQPIPLVRFVCGIDGLALDTIIVNGFSGFPPTPSDGPFDLIVWRILTVDALGNPV